MRVLTFVFEEGCPVCDEQKPIVAQYEAQHKFVRVRRIDMTEVVIGRRPWPFKNIEPPALIPAFMWEDDTVQKTIVGQPLTLEQLEIWTGQGDTE